MRLYEELKRRNVIRVGVAYVLAAWVILQGVDFVLEVIAAPDWVLQVLVAIALMCLPLFLVFSWVYEVTPDGIRLESEIHPHDSDKLHSRRRLDQAIILFLMVAVGVLLYDRLSSGEGPMLGESMHEDMAAREAAAQKPALRTVGEVVSIAVLPFVNMSPDKDQEYFSDGISEELLNVLVGHERLRVPSRTTSFTYKGSDKPISEIGRELNVDHILEGSVRKSEDRIRVTAQLIDVTTDTHLWSQTFTREMNDIFAVQDEIAQAIVQSLQLKFGSDSGGRSSRYSTEHPEAYDQYLLGRHLWKQRASNALLAAVEPLQKAVELDPQYDRAWSALAETYALLPEYILGEDVAVDSVDYVQLGIEAADRALQINPQSASALTARAYIRTMFQYDHEGARADYLKALELDPAYPTARQWYGEFLAVQRRPDEALEQLNLASQADPQSAVIQHVIGWLLIGAGRYEDAAKQYAFAQPMAPEMPSMYTNPMLIHMILGNYDLARENANISARLTGIDNSGELMVIRALEDPKLMDQAINYLDEWTEFPHGALTRSIYYMILGDQEHTVLSLQQAFEAGDPYATMMNRFVIYDPLRADPRFQAMLTKMNLWP